MSLWTRTRIRPFGSPGSARFITLKMRAKQSKKWKAKNAYSENQWKPEVQEMNQEINQQRESFEKPQNKQMQVLGQLNNGVRDFNKIQKNLQIENQELETILKELEDQGLMKVVKKQGLFGIKIELKQN